MLAMTGDAAQEHGETATAITTTTAGPRQPPPPPSPPPAPVPGNSAITAKPPPPPRHRHRCHGHRYRLDLLYSGASVMQHVVHELQHPLPPGTGAPLAPVTPPAPPVYRHHVYTLHLRRLIHRGSNTVLTRGSKGPHDSLAPPPYHVVEKGIGPAKSTEHHQDRILITIVSRLPSPPSEPLAPFVPLVLVTSPASHKRGCR